MNKNILIDKIDTQIKHVNDTLKWVRTFLKGESKDRNSSILINNRRALNRIRYSLLRNPAASIYGESQVGKSYLVDCMLSSKKGSLRVYDGYENTYGFIEELNPLGGGAESTSIVSRFTTKATWIAPEYPIKAIMLSVKDVILTICDSFFNDLKRQSFTLEEDFMEKIEELEQLYGRNKPIQRHISEDDIYDIKEYFLGDYFNKGYNEALRIANSGFFERLGRIIDKIPVEEWEAVFSHLWGKNKHMSDTFRLLITEFEKLGFKEEVYISMDAVLRKNGTILCVDRIYELFGITREGARRPLEEKMKIKTEVNDSAVSLSKSAFCALAAELVFKVDSDLETEKEFLRNIDLLDFPGARSRIEIEEDSITVDNCCEMLLRGKIAYIFNKYSDNYLISNLLFCHHEQQSNVTTLSRLLSGWIKNAIGSTPEEREAFINDAKVSPLFIIGTKFNNDLKRTSLDEKGDEKARQACLDDRWERRFSTILNSIIKETETNKWFNDWTTSNRKFNNIYLLRSYEYSARDGIFSGYLKQTNKIDGSVENQLNIDEKGVLIGECEYGTGYDFFLNGLKQSFINHDFIKGHFTDPNLFWDEAATLNKDGSELITKNLTIVSKQIIISRQHRFSSIIRNLLQELKEIHNKYYHDDNADTRIKSAMEKAGKIEFELDRLFGQDPLFFSQFMSSLLINESDVFDLMLETINHIKMIEDTDTGTYFAIRNKAEIDPNLTDNENIEKIREAYNFNSSEEVIDYCVSKGVDIDELLRPKTTRNFASIISDVVVDYWFDNYLNEKSFKSFIDRGFSEERLTDLFLNMKVLFRKKLNIEDKISNTLRRYVANPAALDVMSDMLADICSEMINRFVNEMGYSYYSPDRWQGIVKTNNQNALNLKLDPEIISREISANKDEISKVFTVLDNMDSIINSLPLDKENMRFLPNYSNYVRWTELMKISFIAACDIPTYDPLANNELRTIRNAVENN